LGGSTGSLLIYNILNRCKKPNLTTQTTMHGHPNKKKRKEKQKVEEINYER
jgi:hypothetical protein